MSVVVYSKANCPQCVIAKNKLEAAGVEFTEVRIDLNPNVRDKLISEGHRSVPILMVDGVTKTVEEAIAAR
jgi:glutaredoxin